MCVWREVEGLILKNNDASTIFHIFAFTSTVSFQNLGRPSITFYDINKEIILVMCVFIFLIKILVIAEVKLLIENIASLILHNLI